MTFDDFTGSKKLWSVRLDGEEDKEFLKLFYDWSDVAAVVFQRKYKRFECLF